MGRKGLFSKNKEQTSPLWWACEVPRLNRVHSLNQSQIDIKKVYMLIEYEQHLQ